VRARKAPAAAIRVVAPEVAHQPAYRSHAPAPEPPRSAAWASPPTLARRLVAILAADVAGYTRLMAEDEERTHLALRAAWQRVVAPSLARHGGRVVKHTGDGFLAEFGSPLAAVCCAVGLQDAMRAKFRFELYHKSAAERLVERRWTVSENDRFLRQWLLEILPPV
jgi:class 3 adenylate cyclase